MAGVAMLSRPTGLVEPMVVPHPSPARARSRPRLSPKLGVVLAATVLAFHYSLQTLVRNLGVDTPLAYVGLVPLVALALAAARSRAAAPDPPIHDRELDYIIGVPLLIAAVAIELVLPAQLSTLFWVWRLDLLALPLFVAGVISLIFGCRALWRQRLPIAFLLLAWPLPYTLLINSWLQSFTDATVAGLRWVVSLVPLAQPAPSADGSLFAISHGGGQFVVSVASSCAGVNGMVGFVLAGTAFAAVVRGRMLPKLVWLTAGLALIWVLNLVRILLIFAAGRQWGEGVAVDGLHPYIGLVVFGLGVIAMILAMPLFRLRFASTGARGRPLPAATTTNGTSPDRRESGRPTGAALALVGVVSLGMAFLNADLSSYELVANELGAPRLAPFSIQPGRPPGWSVGQTNSYTFAKRFFGDDSTWLRYVYTASSGLARSSPPVIADAITSRSLRSFSTYGLEACYRFHGYKIHTIRRVDLGGGITGTVLSYYNPKLGSDWTTLYWHWPVRTAQGTAYERIVLMVRDTLGPRQPGVSAPTAGPSLARTLGLGLNNTLRGNPSADRVSEQLRLTRDFLVGFGASVVRAQPAAES